MHFADKPDTSVSIVQIRRRWIGCHLLLPTLGILLLTAGVGFAFILYLIATKIPGQTFYEVVFVNGSLYVDEGVKNLPDGHQEANLRGLLFTSLAVGHMFLFSTDNPTNSYDNLSC
jgi:hypothetical protein